MNFKKYPKMKLSITLVPILFYVVISNAQKMDTVYIWPNKVSGEVKAKNEPVTSLDTTSNISR